MLVVLRQELKDSWESLEFDFRKVQDRANHPMHTENPGHEEDHQELGPGDGENFSAVYIFFLFMSVGCLFSAE